MSKPRPPLGKLPDLKETIARIARVPPMADGNTESPEFIYRVLDQNFGITYKITSARVLSAAEVRRVLVRAFTRTDAWPNEAGEVEILA